MMALKQALKNEFDKSLKTLIARKGEVAKLKKREMASILAECYDELYDPKANKYKHIFFVDTLSQKIVQDRRALGLSSEVLGALSQLPSAALTPPEEEIQNVEELGNRTGGVTVGDREET